MEDQHQEEGVEKTMEHYVQSNPNAQRSAIVRSEVPNNFEIKPQIRSMIQNNYQFGGLSNEDPNEHIEKFLEICDTFIFKDVTNEAVWLRLFPFTLRDRAKSWYYTLPPDSIRTWDELEKKFLACGTMNKKTPNKVYELIEEMASNVYQYPVERSARGRVVGIHNVDMSNDPYINTYNPGWRSYPNFSWSNNTNKQSSTEQPNAQTRPPPGFQRAAQEQEQKPALRTLFQSRNLGTLPSNSETNPKEQIKAITLISGKVLEEKKQPQVEEDKPNQQQDKEREEQDEQKEMPQYAKFLKEVLLEKKRIEEQGAVMLTERASINLMPLSICRKLNLGEIKETNIMLKFADKSTKKPNGLIEDVLVRIGKFIYPCDFVVLDMEVDWELPLILGRPFLATAAELIDVKQGKLTLTLNDKEIVFDIKQAIKRPSNSCDDTCYFIDVIDECAEHVQQEVMMKDSLERCLDQSCTKEDDDPFKQQEEPSLGNL
ncbi:hypothetical protein H6P81_016224 [Aristolochia fimbriata]|uniref:Retrotransposon gag domain-containing protein n=1 Tax=Aristolochia fimbriata TaxID=158543 RepID=A0AAV7E8D1_ARIFI|nr:hypothetical protein H6P81_016224 [Aristolochia fimbriata]